jgi:hypothetical protein
LTQCCNSITPRTCCITGNRKNGFPHLPQSQNNCMKTRAYWKLCYLFEDQGRRCETQLGLPNVLYWPFISLPPHNFTCLICGESSIYRVLRNNSSVTATQSCDTVVLNA